MVQISPKAKRRWTLALPLLVAVLAGTAGFGAVYVTADDADNASFAPARLAQAANPAGTAASTPSRATALPEGPGRNALSVGQMAAFVFKKPGDPLPDFSFFDGNGNMRQLKDWRGRVVLLNLWATWCTPCRKEMPGLDRLQAALGSDRFEVVAVSADKSGVPGAKAFLDKIKVSKLKVYADPTVRIHAGLKAIGMPASLLIDGEGREIGRLVGPAEWDSPEAKSLIKAAIAQNK